MLQHPRSCVIAERSTGDCAELFDYCEEVGFTPILFYGEADSS